MICVKFEDLPPLPLDIAKAMGLIEDYDLIHCQWRDPR